MRTLINQSGNRPDNNAKIGSVGGNFNKIYVMFLPKPAAKCEHRNLDIPEGPCENAKCENVAWHREYMKWDPVLVI